MNKLLVAFVFLIFGLHDVSGQSKLQLQQYLDQNPNLSQEHKYVLILPFEYMTANQYSHTTWHLKLEGAYYKNLHTIIIFPDKEVVYNSFPQYIDRPDLLSIDSECVYYQGNDFSAHTILIRRGTDGQIEAFSVLVNTKVYHTQLKLFRSLKKGYFKNR